MWISPNASSPRICAGGLWLACTLTLSAWHFCVVLAPAGGATLAELFNGASITAGNSRFSEWELKLLDSTAVPSPLLTQINVLPIASDITRPGLSYSANGQLATSAINAIDLTFTYRLQALTGAKSFEEQSLEITGITFGGPGGTAYISQAVTSSGGVDLGAAVVIADHESNFFQFAVDSSFVPQLGFSVSTNVFITGLSGMDTINLASFTQRFSQTGSTSLAGDFDEDGDVDGRDFLCWQRGGSPTPLSTTDLANWQANYGTALLVVPALTGVPEPSASVLVILGLPLAAGRKFSRC